MGNLSLEMSPAMLQWLNQSLKSPAHFLLIKSSALYWQSFCNLCQGTEKSIHYWTTQATKANLNISFQIKTEKSGSFPAIIQSSPSHLTPTLKSLMDAMTDRHQGKEKPRVSSIPTHYPHCSTPARALLSAPSLQTVSTGAKEKASCPSWEGLIAAQRWAGNLATVLCITWFSWGLFLS